MKRGQEYLSGAGAPFSTLEIDPIEPVYIVLCRPPHWCACASLEFFLVRNICFLNGYYKTGVILGTWNCVYELHESKCDNSLSSLIS
jgi:hypothetical protein